MSQDDENQISDVEDFSQQELSQPAEVPKTENKKSFLSGLMSSPFKLVIVILLIGCLILGFLYMFKPLIFFRIFNFGKGGEVCCGEGVE